MIGTVDVVARVSLARVLGVLSPARLVLVGWGWDSYRVVSCFSPARSYGEVFGIRSFCSGLGFVSPARVYFVVSVGSWGCMTPVLACSNFLFLGGVLGSGTGPVVERGIWETRPLRL